MKYAREVIDLLAAYPDLSFRMNHIVRHVLQGGEQADTRRHAIRVGVRRVVQQLEESGQIIKNRQAKNSATYRWTSSKVIHEVLGK